MQILYTYRFQVLIELLAMILRIFLFRIVWTAVYAGRAEMDGILLSEVISMTTIANLQIYILESSIPGFFNHRIRSGTIAIDLARPVPFAGQIIAEQIGSTLAIMPFIVLVMPIALLAGGIQLPGSGAALAGYLVALLLAFIVTNLIGTLIGLMAFWTMEIHEIRSILIFVGSFFSGALVPLWFFPDWLRRIADWLPFQAQSFLPISIYLGRIEGQAIFEALGIQLLWIIILMLIITPIWKHALRRVVVQGG